MKKSMLDAYSNLRVMYDDNTRVLYFKSGTATFSALGRPDEEVAL